MLHDVVSLKGKSFKTLVVESEQEHQTGLMWQQWPPPVMTFPYKYASYRKFWMKNTVSPLDIIFCRAGKIVGIFKGEPLSTTMVGPEEMSDLVIELPHGTAKDLGLEVGDYVGFNPTEQKNTTL